jgi:hypothetical protein
MGYRSDVRLVLVFPTLEHKEMFNRRYQLEVLDEPSFVRDFWERDDPRHEDPESEAPQTHTVYPEDPKTGERLAVDITDGGCIRKMWTDVKWYDSFPEVKFVGRMKALCLECKGAWVLGRIGEEDDDVEVDCETFDPDTLEEYDYPTAHRYFSAHEYVAVQRSLTWGF